MMTSLTTYNNKIQAVQKKHIDEYRPSIIPTRVQDMKPTHSISELLKVDEKKVKAHIAIIAARWLDMNEKARGLTRREQYDILINHISINCPNLELQEIEYIFRAGVIGTFGPIYNDISLDTICGKNGWIEMYYQEHRPNRPEQNEKIPEPKPNPNAISEAEFLRRHPEIKRRKMLERFRERISNKLIAVTKYDLKFFLKLVGNTEQDYIKILAHIKKQYDEFPYKETVTLKEFANSKFRTIILKGEL